MMKCPITNPTSNPLAYLIITIFQKMILCSTQKLVSQYFHISWTMKNHTISSFPHVRDHAPSLFYRMLGQIHGNGWSRVVASQNWGSTNYIFPFKLRVLQWSRYLFNYWKNKKIIIEKIPHFINLKLKLHWL